MNDGKVSEFARNNLNFLPGFLGPYTRDESKVTFTGNQVQNEWAGACLSPDGEWLFVNIQTPRDYVRDHGTLEMARFQAA